MPTSTSQKDATTPLPASTAKRPQSRAVTSPAPDPITLSRLDEPSTRRRQPGSTAHWVAARRDSFILTTTDLLVIAASTIAALAGRYQLPGPEPTGVDDLVAQLAVPLALGWLAVLACTGAYTARNHGVGTSEYNRVLGGSLITAGALGVTNYIADLSLSRVFYLLLFAIGIPALLLSRVLVRRIVHRLRTRGKLTHRVLVAGSPHRAAELITVVRRESWLGYDIVGQAPHPGRHPEGADIPVVATVQDIVDAVREADAEIVIFTEGAFATSADFRRVVWELEELHIDVIVVPGLTDISASRVQIRPVAGLPLVHVERPTTQSANRILKRTFDLVISSLITLAVLPLMGLVALAIKLDDGGPVIFTQERVGRNGHTFRFLKFRSMVADAEARLATLAADNQGAGVLFKMTHDPRITRVGRWIRRGSLDELPQLFNILRGEMSLVGPRPALPHEVAKYHSDMRRRLEVRPGLTGLWQVSGRSNLSWEDTVRLDLYYTDNWSMLQDLAILVRTVRAVVQSDGAY